MLVLVIILFILSVILFISAPKSWSNRWISLFVFLASVGGFTDLMWRFIIPYYSKSPTELNQNLVLLHSFISATTHYVGPFTYLMFAMYFSDEIYRKQPYQKWIFCGIPILFIVVMNIVFPVTNFTYLYWNSVPMLIYLTIATVIYLIYSNYLLIRCCFEEKIKFIKQQKIIVASILVPVSTFGVYTNYYLIIFDDHLFWNNQIGIVCFVFAVFLALLVKNGVMGLKIQIHRYSLKNTVESLVSGTSMINHAIKNETLKIQVSSENIKRNAGENPEITLNNEIIERSTQYLLKIVEKINLHMQEIVFNEEQNNLASILSEAIGLNEALLRKKQIVVENNMMQNLELSCDKIHLCETFNNIIKNSIEACSDFGKIVINASEHGKFYELSISDNGKGISKENLKKIFNPYFTTKKTALNFGVGLSYCLNVIQKLDGTMDIQSEEGNGTTVFIRLPKKRILKRTANI